MKPRITKLPRAMRILAEGIQRTERERKAAIITRPMRDLFALLATGEVCEVDGQPAMRMPDIDTRHADRAEWCAIAPAIAGWIDFWQRLAPDLHYYHLGVLAARLADDKPLTPRLVEQARAEFEATVTRIAELPPGAIDRAITTTRLAWEFERMAG